MRIDSLGSIIRSSEVSYAKLILHVLCWLLLSSGIMLLYSVSEALIIVYISVCSFNKSLPFVLHSIYLHCIQYKRLDEHAIITLNVLL